MRQDALEQRLDEDVERVATAMNAPWSPSPSTYRHRHAHPHTVRLELVLHTASGNLTIEAPENAILKAVLAKELGPGRYKVFQGGMKLPLDQSLCALELQDRCRTSTSPTHTIVRTIIVTVTVTTVTVTVTVTLTVTLTLTLTLRAGSKSCRWSGNSCLQLYPLSTMTTAPLTT